MVATATSTKKAARQGFVLAQLAVALMILTILAVFASSYVIQKINDSAAENTGKYLVNVRGGLVDLQIKHEAFLSGTDVSAAPAGTYPAPPAFISWQPAPAGAGGGQIAVGSVGDLITSGQLPSGFGLYPPLGQKALWLLHRTGTCPSDTCMINAFVYTCHPISSERSTKLAVTSCSTPQNARAQADMSLVGQTVMSSEGYGGSNLTESASHFSGALLGQSAPRALFPDLSNHPGRVVLAAGLNATPFNQFVRQGDTRHIFLRNNLTVDGVIETKLGMLIDPETPITEGGNCAASPNGLYAMTAQKTLAVCLDNRWFSLTSYLVRNTVDNVAHNATVPPINNCPAPMTPWQHVALQRSDFRIGGSSINIRGNLSGSISGTGTVNQAGQYNLNGGTFGGTFQSAGTSHIDSAQSVSIDSTGRVTINPNGANARAVVTQGCRVP